MNDLLTTTEYRLVLVALASGPVTQAICLVKNRNGNPSPGLVITSTWSLMCGFVLLNFDPDEIGKALFLLSFVPVLSGLAGVLSWLAYHLPQRLK